MTRRTKTASTIIETIQHVNYVEKGSVAGQKRDISTLTLKNGEVIEKQKSEVYGAETQRLLPTDLGRVTNDYLVEHFPQIMSYDFTAQEDYTSSSSCHLTPPRPQSLMSASVDPA